MPIIYLRGLAWPKMLVYHTFFNDFTSNEALAAIDYPCEIHFDLHFDRSVLPLWARMFFSKEEI
jgi:hypothetical protein